jgi:hypothetical protein
MNCSRALGIMIKSSACFLLVGGRISISNLSSFVIVPVSSAPAVPEGSLLHSYLLQLAPPS